VTTRAGRSYSRRFQQRENNLWALGLAVCSPLHLSPPTAFSTPPSSFAFDEFLAYFLAESLGHVLLVLEDQINGTFEN
jgi:hypothetical protein